MTSIKFNKKKDKLLIDLVRSNSVLYDPSNEQFKDNIAKHKVWESISEALETPVTDIKKRWKHIRDHYHKKAKANLGKGKTKRKNKWEYMPLLTFLSDTLSQCNTSPFTYVEANYEHDETEEFDIKMQNEAENPVQNIKKEFLFDQNINCGNTSEASRDDKGKSNSSFLRTNLDKRQDEPEMATPVNKFFESMADIVSQFPPHLAAEARLKVCQVITDIELKMHSEHLRSMSNSSDDT